MFEKIDEKDGVVANLIEKIPDDWTKVTVRGQERIGKSFFFNSFDEVVDFFNKVAKVVQSMDHHPEINILHGVVQITTFTIDAGMVTKKDVELANAINKLE